MSKKPQTTKPETTTSAPPQRDVQTASATPIPSTLVAGEAERTRADILASASDAERARVAGEAKILYPSAAPSVDPKIEACACAAHEANRAYCIALGDTSQPSWDEAPEWQRSSAINGVKGAFAGNTPEQSHESWLAEKKATGWAYGPVKDPAAKLHPCFVPYAELPPAQRAKDAIFTTAVRSMGVALGIAAAAPSTPPVDATPAEREQQLLERAQLAEKLAQDTEARYELHLIEARARIAELETAASRASRINLSRETVETLEAIARHRGQSVDAMVNEMVVFVGSAKEFDGELRAAAQRLRASTLPESDVVADAIRTLVEHHDPQDPTEA